MIEACLPDPQQPNTEPVGGLINFFGRWWGYAKDYWSVLRPMRFCVFVWIAITLLIVLVSQSQDALLTLLEDVAAGSSVGLLNAAVFFGLAFFWAFQTFYWARFVSRLPLRPRPAQQYEPAVLSDADIEELNRRVPHWLGALVLISVWVALFRANWGVTVHQVQWAPPNSWGLWLAVAIQEAIITAVMYGLLKLYLRLVRERGELAAWLNRKTGLALFNVKPFARDLGPIALGATLKRAALWLAIVTLAVFVISAFVDFGDTRLPACLIAVVWIALGFWAARRITGLPPETVAVLRINLALFGALFLVSISPDMPFLGWLALLPSAPIMLSVAVAWVFLGTFFVALPGEVLRLPLTTMLVLFAIVASGIGWRDNHAVRTAASTDWNSTTLDAAFDDWWDKVGSRGPQPAPLVLVATAGGASRAAYWTAKVLNQLEVDHPGFHEQVFAISSVSGGSLGAVVHRAMLNHLVPGKGNTPASDCADRNPTTLNLVACGREIINHDFLGPTFLTGLYADLTQRYLPGAVFPDRASALERSWEEAWQRTLPGLPGLEQPFHSLWSSRSWLPALLINGTSEKTGRRIITSNLVIDDAFPDAIDYFGKLHPAELGGGTAHRVDIPVSTAAHNSARFPYIDAAGTLISPKSGVTDRIVDGGYFENFGAASIYDLLGRLNRLTKAKGRNVKFFVLQISSDPEFESPARRDMTWEKRSPLSLNVAADFTAPPVALLNVGSALGYRATQVLWSFVDSIQAADPSEHYAHFVLTDPHEAMSWVLSRRSVRCLETEWARNEGNYQTLAKFMGWTLPPPPPTPPAARKHEAC